MKTILAIIVFAASASAQYFVPCLEAAAPASTSETIFVPGMKEPLPVVSAAKWETRQTADTAVYKIAPGSWYAVPVSMPAPGRCVGSFSSYDDSEDAAKALIDAFGNIIVDKPKGYIEVLILTPANFERLKANRQFAAVWSSGRRFKGSFDLNLPAGYYYVIINNRFSSFAPKSVTFSLGPSPVGRD